MSSNNNLEKTINLITQEALLNLENTDIFIVEIDIQQGNRILIYIDSQNGVSISDCVRTSRYIEKEMDEAGHIYELQVSSSGLEMPLKIPKQYEINIGRSVDIIMNDGSKISGKLLSVENESIVIETKIKKKQENRKKKIEIISNETILFSQIKTTKIVPDFSGIK